MLILMFTHQVANATEETLHRIWSQTPISVDPNLNSPGGMPVFCGWHEPARSTENTGEKRQWRMTVDDFPSPGHVPVTRLRWWGTYKAWTKPEYPDITPQSWHIGFWAHLEDGWALNELFPERLMWSVEVPVERVVSRPVGWVEYPNRSLEVCFEYELSLEPNEWFWPSHFPARGDIFWISITTVYAADITQQNLWGWLTRPQSWRREAQTPSILGDWPSPDERLFPGRIYPINVQLDCPEGETYDMAFELLTDDTWCLWDQSISMKDTFLITQETPQYHEPNDSEPTLLGEVADDWVFTGNTPVIAMSWQGSYVGYHYQACECAVMPSPRQPDYFLLSILADANEQPGSTVWEYSAHAYQEVLVDVNHLPDGEPNEAVFRYTVRLDRADWFDQADPNQSLWFKVTAVYQDTPDLVPYPWTWTAKKQQHGQPAQHRNNIQSTPQWAVLTDPQDHAVDMSFTLYTAPAVAIPEGAEDVAVY
jgi:hypothetical protein